MYLSDPIPQMAKTPDSTEPMSDGVPAPDENEGESAKAEENRASGDQNVESGEDTETDKAEVPAGQPIDQSEDKADKADEKSDSDSRSGKLVAGGTPDAQANGQPPEVPVESEQPSRSSSESHAADDVTPNGDQAEAGVPEPQMAEKTAATGAQPAEPADVAAAREGSKKAEPKVAAVQGTETAAPEQEKTTEEQSVQQAALPKVVAPDHNSLPLWKRNRQRIDRRWLKDSTGKPKPRIAFILSELGLAPRAAEEIIKKLPPAITLSFSPYAKPQTLEYLSALARSNGHEVMLDLPLEPIDFPQRDPGPKALLTALEPAENLDRLDWSLGRSTGYVGVAVWMGSRFVGSPRQMQPLMEAIQGHGLVYLDNAEREDSLGPGLATEMGIPAVTSHRYVDVPLASRDAIDARLAQVERIALQFGSAVAMGRPFPVTVERLAEWSAEIEKRGIILVPITVLAEDAVRRQNLAETPSEKKRKSNSSQGSNSKTE